MLSGIVEAIIDGKTVKVSVNRVFIHRLYKKVVRVKRYYLCDCKKNVSIGDIVSIVQTRKISKMKSYAVV